MAAANESKTDHGFRGRVRRGCVMVAAVDCHDERSLRDAGRARPSHFCRQLGGRRDSLGRYNWASDPGLTRLQETILICSVNSLFLAAVAEEVLVKAAASCWHQTDIEPGALNPRAKP